MTDPTPEIPELPRADEALRDGIGEEDNAIPAWWWWTFLGTVIFAFAYVPWYTFSGWSQETQYAAEVAVAEARIAAVRATLPTTNPFRGDPEALAEGQQVFLTICAACHTAQGTGLVGPSLVDDYWKYGDDDETLYETVAKGRPGGMPAWESQLGSEKIWKALLYMQSLPRSDGPGMGAPGYQASGG